MRHFSSVAYPALPAYKAKGKMAKKQLFIAMMLLGMVILAYAFFSATGTQKDSNEPAGVILTAPPGYALKKVGAVDEDLFKGLARKAIEHLNTAPSEKRVALGYTNDGRNGFFLINLTEETLGQIVINRYGTAVQKIWNGSPRLRLQHAIKTGSLTPTGYDEPISRNLYH